MRCTDIGKQAFVILRQNVQKCLFLKNLHSPSAGTNAPLRPQLFQLPYAHFSPFSSTSDPHVVQKTIALSGQRSEPDQNKGVSSVVFHQTCLSPPFVKCQSAERDVRTMIQFFVLYQIRFKRFVIVFRASCIWFFQFTVIISTNSLVRPKRTMTRVLFVVQSRRWTAKATVMSQLSIFSLASPNPQVVIFNLDPLQVD